MGGQSPQNCCAKFNWRYWFLPPLSAFQLLAILELDDRKLTRCSALWRIHYLCNGRYDLLCTEEEASIRISPLSQFYITPPPINIPQLAEQRALREAEAETEPASTSVNPESNVLANTTSLLTPPQRPSATMTEKLKAWALSGLTPAEKEEEMRQLESTESDVVAKDDILVKDEKAKGGVTGTLGSITGWWSGR